jgi:signal transduction histidine kinase
LSRPKKSFSHEFREEAVVDQLRHLALDNGLVAGLRAECQRFDDRLSVRPTVAGRLDGLPAAVVAGYRIVVEALANAARLAHASECWVTVERSTELALCIADGRVGIGEAPCPGIGLGSMPERAADLGGSCTIAAGMSSGTVVSIRVPVSNPVSM